MTHVDTARDAQLLRDAADAYLAWCPGHFDAKCPRQAVSDALRAQAAELDGG